MESKGHGNPEAPRTTIGLRRSTKNSLNHNRSPGQSYDGFIRQLLSLWERMQRENRTVSDPAEANRSAGDDS